MKYDIIIIGAGLGGLTAGAKLAKEGKKVLLIEQHSIPGGCATTFKRGDYTLEVGLHEMDGLHEKDLKTKIFRDLAVFESVEFLRAPEFYRFINDRYDVVIPHDPEKVIKTLSGLFPDDEAGIRLYFDQILNPRKKPEESPKEKTIGDFLDSIIKNDDLKLILLGNLGYFHDDPYTLSLLYYSIAEGSYYSGGGNFIKGGSQKLSEYLANYIFGHNGEVIYNHLVTDILFENGKATGVVYKKNRTGNTESQKAFANDIIVNAALPNLVTMLPHEFSNALKQEAEGIEIGASLLTVYFGFKKPLKELGSKHYSTFVFDSSVKSQSDIISNNKGDITKRSFTFVDYSQVDAELAPAGKSVGAICCIDYTDDWDTLSKTEYKTKKEYVKEAFIKRLENLVPGASGQIEYCEVGTSKTVQRYTLNPKGAVYGFAQKPDKKEITSLKAIDNLYIASAWGKFGGGFSGAIYSGYMCAFDILRKRR